MQQRYKTSDCEYSAAADIGDRLNAVQHGEGDISLDVEQPDEKRPLSIRAEEHDGSPAANASGDEASSMNKNSAPVAPEECW